MSVRGHHQPVDFVKTICAPRPKDTIVNYDKEPASVKERYAIANTEGMEFGISSSLGKKLSSLSWDPPELS